MLYCMLGFVFIGNITMKSEGQIHSPTTMNKIYGKFTTPFITWAEFTTYIIMWGELTTPIIPCYYIFYVITHNM